MKFMFMHFIFDFDGTLIDSFQRLLEKFIMLSDEFHFRKIEKDEINFLRNLSSKEIIKFLQIPLYQLPQIILRVRKSMSEDIHTLSSFPELPKVLIAMHQSNATLGILTTNSKANVNNWLKLNKLDALFSYVYSEPSFLGKKHALKKIIHKHHSGSLNTYYIGDETRDIEAAKYCNIYSVAVTWGFNSEEALIRSEPHFVAHQPADLLSLII